LRNHVKKEARLKDEQARAVDRIALETEQEIAHTDKQATKIINAIRVRYPKGRLNDGESLPLPPPELHTLNEQRKNIILQARERLRAALGEAEFKRFDDFTKEKTARKIKKLGAEPTNLISSGSPQEQGVSDELCKRSSVQRRDTPFKDDRECLHRLTPIWDGHRPLFRDIAQG
jgi:hypothetical protein